MKESAQAPRVEPRWPVALAILAVLFLLAILPERVRLVPIWITYAIGIAVLAPIAAVWLTAAKARWLRVERTVVLFFVVVKVAANLASLAYLIDAMVSRSASSAVCSSSRQALRCGPPTCSCSRCCTGKSIAAARKPG